jgi:hypothetical protein
MLTQEEQKIIASVKANWDERSVPGQLVKIIERLTVVAPRPVRSERAIPRLHEQRLSQFGRNNDSHCKQ